MIAVVVRVEYRIASLAQLCNDPGIVEPVFRRAVAFGKVMSEIDQNFRPGSPPFAQPLKKGTLWACLQYIVLRDVTYLYTTIFLRIRQ